MRPTKMVPLGCWLGTGHPPLSAHSPPMPLLQCPGLVKEEVGRVQAYLSPPHFYLMIPFPTQGMGRSRVITYITKWEVFGISGASRSGPALELTLLKGSGFCFYLEDLSCCTFSLHHLTSWPYFLTCPRLGSLDTKFLKQLRFPKVGYWWTWVHHEHDQYRTRRGECLVCPR